MENKEILVSEKLNGCFGKLFRGGDLSSGTGYFRCECNTSNVSSNPEEENCNYCPIMGKKIKITDYQVQLAALGISVDLILLPRHYEEIK